MAPVVTISASFGAGGSAVGPAVADRLGLPFVDRAIPVEVARRLELPETEALELDEHGEGLLARILRAIAPVSGPIGPEVVPPRPPERARAFKDETEEVIRRVADTTGGVVLGRAAMVVLRGRPDVLSVRLDGPPEARLERVLAEHPDLDRSEAAALQRSSDRAREAYVRVFYRVRPDDPRLYHLVVDSTALPLDAVVDLVVLAAKSRWTRA